MHMRTLKMAVVLVGVMSVPAFGSLDVEGRLEARRVETEPGYFERTLSNLSAGAICGIKVILNGAVSGASYFVLAAPTTSVLASRGVIQSTVYNQVLKNGIPTFAGGAFILGLLLEGAWGFKESNKTTYQGAVGRGFCVGIPIYLCFFEFYLKHKIAFL